MRSLNGKREVVAPISAPMVKLLAKYLFYVRELEPATYAPYRFKKRNKHTNPYYISCPCQSSDRISSKSLI
jgi:hypothetical protein